ncbi:hypothetical protein EJ08DRAFT_658156 [Tothia fuscella]|uniref:Uncharacterized protein n=1 Tax=Tothia fuscella TaxID=1048955 RepID=A0A9P4U266_9PEZI|nr:hypothetical protein EJ08DRAFT_658156 [Tothia fuscella]
MRVSFLSLLLVAEVWAIPHTEAKPEAQATKWAPTAQPESYTPVSPTPQWQPNADPHPLPGAPWSLTPTNERPPVTQTQTPYTSTVYEFGPKATVKSKSSKFPFKNPFSPVGEAYEPNTLIPDSIPGSTPGCRRGEPTSVWGDGFYTNIYTDCIGPVRTTPTLQPTLTFRPTGTRFTWTPEAGGTAYIPNTNIPSSIPGSTPGCRRGEPTSVWGDGYYTNIYTDCIRQTARPEPQRPCNDGAEFTVHNPDGSSIVYPACNKPAEQRPCNRGGPVTVSNPDGSGITYPAC